MCMYLRTCKFMLVILVHSFTFISLGIFSLLSRNSAITHLCVPRTATGILNIQLLGRGLLAISLHLSAQTQVYILVHKCMYMCEVI